MNTTTRALASLLVGATALLGGTVACATPHTTDGFISEMRAEMDDYESRNVADSQIVMMGQGMCSYPESLDPAFYENDYTSPAQQERSAAQAAITKRYCDVLPPMTTPVNETDAGVPIEGDTGYSAAPPMPPTPLVLGEPIAINYGGTEDSMTYTVNSVGRCGASLRLDVTVKTGSVFSTNDSIAQSSDYVDTDGITHAGPSSLPTDYNCYEGALPSGYEMKPDRTYTGHISFEIPSGTGTTLSLYGTDGVVRTLDVTGK